MNPSATGSVGRPNESPQITHAVPCLAMQSLPGTRIALVCVDANLVPRPLEKRL